MNGYFFKKGTKRSPFKHKLNTDDSNTQGSPEALLWYLKWTLLKLQTKHPWSILLTFDTLSPPPSGFVSSCPPSPNALNYSFAVVLFGRRNVKKGLGGGEKREREEAEKGNKSKIASYFSSALGF